MASERKGFTVKWKIENFGFWWSDHQSLDSPHLFLNKMGGTRWKFNLKGSSDVLESFLAFSLVRGVEDDGPDIIMADIELSALASDDSPLKLQEYKNVSFSNRSVSPFLLLAHRDVFELKKNVFLPQDILTLQCRMWPNQGPVSESGVCGALTRIGVERKCFNVVVEQFSALDPGQERQAYIRSIPEEIPCVYMNMRVTQKGNVQIVGMNTDGTFTKTCSYKFFLLDAAGIREECMKEDKWFDCFGTRIFYLSLTKKWLMDNKKRYLPNDVLSLCCEMKALTGLVLNEIDKPEYKRESLRCATRSNKQKKRKMSSTTLERVEMVTTLKDHLLSLYQERILCDTKLRSGTETFAAHKIVLSARSPVFKAMFTHGIKEEANDCIDVSDLSADTIRRMLLFMYTDTVEVLDWNNAKDMYLAAEKYEILSLKRLCSSFLEENVGTSNVCEILALADMHQDSDLKSVMQNFILRNDKEVFESEEWKIFVISNSELAAETMGLKYV